MNKLHLVITGRRNTGKSSLINTLLAQKKAIVSPIAGTTTDPVKKSFEIPGYASVIFTDTAGIDDEGELGKQRIEKTSEAIQQADGAILVIKENTFGSYEEELIRQFEEAEIPFLIVHNQRDRTPLQTKLKKQLEEKYKTQVLDFSTNKDPNTGILEALKVTFIPPVPCSLIGEIVQSGDLVLLVTPIDSEAPAGRMILPQVQLIRDILDNHCINVVLQPEEIPAFLKKTALLPALVVTDSQAFGQVAALIPEDIPLTSFSIVLAHRKGNFLDYLKGTSYIPRLKDGDRILMLESCSHHVSCEDIGRVKIPTLLRKYTGKQLEFDFIAGLDSIRRPITDYRFVIQCGGCMITDKQLQNRLRPIIKAGIPVSNYGMALAYVQGIFQRAVQPFICRPNPFS